MKKVTQPTQDGTTFEFLLTLENNIIVQRYFIVNNYNYKSKNGIDLYYWITDVCGDISNMLKIKNLEYMSDNYHFIVEEELTNKDEKLKEEYFKLEIKLENDIFISRIFPAHIYHPKARYCDIRPKIRKYLGEVTSILSSRKLESSYLKYDLK